MSLVCSVIFIHHAFNANILDKDYAFSDGEILMVDNAVRTHFEPYERHFKEIGFNENTMFLITLTCSSSLVARSSFLITLTCSS